MPFKKGTRMAQLAFYPEGELVSASTSFTFFIIFILQKKKNKPKLEIAYILNVQRGNERFL